jgi:hypothetical protein
MGNLLYCSLRDPAAGAENSAEPRHEASTLKFS